MAQTALDSNENDPRWDAGLTRPASIGGLVWDDVDADGVQDPGEVGIAGVTVRLFNGAGTEVGSTVTDVDGEYDFAGLTPGACHIEVDIPDGLVASPQDEGADDAVDSDIVDSDIDVDGIMASTTLDPGEDETGWDAGLHPGDP